MTSHIPHPESPRVPLLCYVTDRRAFGPGESQATARLLETIENAARAGVDAVQIREKDLGGRALLELAHSAVDRAPRANIVVNDRLDVALAAAASGVHLGEDSLPLADAVAFRSPGRAPARFLIGRSCHSLKAAIEAQRDGADYIFFGPVFATPSKARFGPPQGTGALASVCRGVRIPVLAIGGISVENARLCISAGAAGVAAIRLFQESKDLAEVVRGLKRSN